MQLLESRHSTRRRPRWVKFVVLFALVGLALGAWKGWDRARPRYLRWKQERALHQAKQFIEQRDPANAQVALEVALKTIPGNADAVRVAADMLEQVGSAQAMRLRRMVVQLEPGSAIDSAKLVMCCLRFRDFNAAKDVLSTTAPSVANEPVMLQAALAFAVATDNRPVADLLFTRLRENAPDNESLQHAHALLRLRHPKDERRAEARRELEELASRNPSLALQINREFAADALARRDYTDLKSRQKLILADPAATFSDRLQKANVDLLVDQQPIDTVLAELAPVAGKTEADAAQFVQWLLVQNREKLADEWLDKLPAEIRKTPAVKAVEADTVAQLGDWDRLALLLNDGAWGPISPATVKLAMAAHTVDRPSHPSLRRETWDMTIESCSNAFPALRVLQRLAAVWKWNDESERTLWTIARAHPDQTWAHQVLFDFYRDKKDTKGMREVMAVLRSSDGTVPRYQYDWALLTLLTTPTAAWNPAKETMQHLHQAEPTNATYATGYALALAQAGRGREAMEVVGKLSEVDRQYALRQPYLAFVYGVAKRADALERALSLAEGVTFLPEETYLFTRAREELNRKPEKPAKSASTTAAPAEPKL